jgi:hypothetical protein
MGVFKELVRIKTRSITTPIAEMGVMKLEPGD